jgi:hypothetical protein
VHSIGLLVFAWNAQRRSNVRRRHRLEVDGIVGNHVDRLLDSANAAPRGIA